MVNQAMAFMLAGHETTSVLMTWFVYCMATHPHFDAELHRELVSSPFGQLARHAPDRVTHEAVASLEFLRMCVDEVLRLYPPVAMIIRVTTETVISHWTHLFLAPYCSEICPGVPTVLTDTDYYLVLAVSR